MPTRIKSIEREEEKLAMLIAEIDKVLPDYPEDHRQRNEIEAQREQVVKRLNKIRGQQ